jgi:hypothetical protein
MDLRIVNLLILYILLPSGPAHAQFNQGFQWRPVPDGNGGFVQVAHWRREDWLEFQPVIELPRPVSASLAILLSSLAIPSFASQSVLFPQSCYDC